MQLNSSTNVKFNMHGAWWMNLHAWFRREYFNGIDNVKNVVDKSMQEIMTLKEFRRQTMDIPYTMSECFNHRCSRSVWINFSVIRGDKLIVCIFDVVTKYLPKVIW